MAHAEANLISLNNAEVLTLDSALTTTSMTDPAKKRKWLPLSTETTAPISDENYIRISFPGWFNEQSLSDLVIHSTKDDNATKYHCHKFVIMCASDKLYEALMKNQMEVASDPTRLHVVIVPELQGKDSMIRAFLEAIYDESVVYDKTRKEQFDYAGDVCMTYDMPGLRNAMCDGAKLFRNVYSFNIDKYLPKLNSETPLSDFTLYLDKEKKTYFKTHRIMLAQASLYFKGLFTSGMKDSTTSESVLDLDVAVDHSIMSEVVGKLINLLYSKEKLTEKSLHGQNAENLVVLSSVISKYLFSNLRPVCNMRVASLMGLEFIKPSLKYQNQELLDNATQVLVQYLGSIKLSEYPADYLETLRVDNESNIFHALVERSSTSPSCKDHIKDLEKIFGSKSTIGINTVNKDGNTCLHIACRKARGSGALIQWMISRKMDVNLKNVKGETPLSIALASFVPEILDIQKTLEEERRQEKKNFHRLVLDDEKKKKDKNKEKEKAKKIPTEYTIIDHLLLAQATMDLTKEENMKLLLSYALSFEEYYDEVVWEIIKGWLSQQKVERLKSVLDEGFIVYAFKKLNKRPLKLLFNTLKVPFSVDSASLDDDDATSKTIQIIALSEIKIGSTKYPVHSMSLCTNKAQHWGKDSIFTSCKSVTLSTGLKKYEFPPNALVIAVLKGLIRLEHGSDTKHITEHVKPPPQNYRW
jgi:hypothetical protein